MTDGDSDSFAPARALAPVGKGSLTRRVLAQKPPPPSIRERFLGFDWGRYIKLSFVLCVAVPTLLTAIYSLFIASPTFVAEVRFAVRPASDRPLVESYIADSSMAALPSPSASRDAANSKKGGNSRSGSTGGSASPDGMATGARASQIATLALGAITGGISSEPYVVADFIKSPDIVRSLDEDGWLRQRFASGDPDWLQALPEGASIERLSSYWRSAISAAVDINTGLLSLDVTAFTPEDAVEIAQRIIRQSEALVNRMAERARRDRLATANADLSRAEARYLASEAAMRDLRGQDAIIDPVQQAEGAFDLLLELISARIALDVQLRVLTPSLSEDAPQIKSLRKRIAALDAEIAKAKAALTNTGGDSDAAANYLAAFEGTETERRLSALLYSAALDNVERAHLESERQASYLAVFVPPYPPAHASGPDTLANVLTIFVSSLLLWAVVSLFVAVSREHLS